jgi:uncharacterized membrane protein
MSIARPISGADDLARAQSSSFKVSQSAGAIARPRLDAIDLLRGLVIVLMALDHTRGFFAPGGAELRDVTDPALFLTRWITHYCAPTFILLAGLSAWLYGARGRSTGEISRFLFTRGFWLILLEFTIVKFGWTFSLGFQGFFMQVIWAIGASMVILAGLVWLPRIAIAVFGFALIFGHNLFDGVTRGDFGAAEGIWTILHQPGILKIGTMPVGYVLYPLVPWIGVMAAGYALGPIYRLDAETRRRWLLGLGGAVTIGFVLLRATNLYGDPAPWQAHESWSATVLSFINAEKYPPSLLYLAMTLGPALILLALFEGVGGRVAGWMLSFGRVPLFFYVVHLLFYHALAVIYAQLILGDSAWLFSSGPPQKPAGYGLSLPAIYVVWVAGLAMLYPLCRWLAAVKQHRREWWWSYL